MLLKLRILSLYKKWAISKINHDQLKNQPSNVKINMSEDSEPIAELQSAQMISLGGFLKLECFFLIDALLDCSGL